jgi:tRNA (guanine-N7-)-methyltransferase
MWQAEHNPSVGLIGCEPFEEGVVKALTGSEAKSLGNVRLWPDDARPLLGWLPEASISRAFILFPDPWPKKRQQKRRLINPTLLAALVRVLRPGASLRIATDIADYTRTILLAVRATPALRWSAQQASDWRIRPPDWPMTRYEAKALAAGRRCTYLTFERNR